MKDWEEHFLTDETRSGDITVRLEKHSEYSNVPVYHPAYYA